MRIRLDEGLAFVSVALVFRDRSITLDRVVLDTGSVYTVFETDKLAQIGLEPAYDDFVDEIRGIGGTEAIVTKQVDSISVDSLQVRNFSIQLSRMKYNRDLDGLLGLDFLLATKAIIDLDQLELRQANSA